MRTKLLSAACMAALLAEPVLAQDEQTQATPEAETQPAEGTQPAQTEGDVSATEDSSQPAVEQPAVEQPAATTTATDATEGGGAAADPRQALAAAVTRINQERDTYWGALGAGPGEVELGTDPAVSDPNDPAATQPVDPEAQQRLVQALDEFDQAVEQYGQSAQSEQVQAQMAQLRTQSETIRQQLETDPQTAMQSIDLLTQAAMTLPQAEISAEARNIHDRTVVSSDGQQVGQVGGLLITADGRVEAVIIARSGALGLGGSQHVVAWDQIQLQGEQIMVNLTQDQVEQLSEYVVD